MAVEHYRYVYSQLEAKEPWPHLVQVAAILRELRHEDEQGEEGAAQAEEWRGQWAAGNLQFLGKILLGNVRFIMGILSPSMTACRWIKSAITESSASLRHS